jgi:hypothetical protein
LRSWSVSTARSSISSASNSAVPSTCTRANRPGVNRRSQVGQHGPRADRAGARVDLVVDEVDRARVRVAVLVGEADAHGVPRRLALALARELGVAQVGLLVAFEIDVDRVERDQRGEQRRVGLREIACR